MDPNSPPIPRSNPTPPSQSPARPVPPVLSLFFFTSYPISSAPRLPAHNATPFPPPSQSPARPVPPVLSLFSLHPTPSTYPPDTPPTPPPTPTPSYTQT